MSKNNNSAPLVIDYLEIPPESLTDSVRVLCKFVILRYRDRLHMIYGPVAEYPYHANLLERFCLENGILNSWASKPTLLNLHDGETRIRGGGYLEILASTREIKFGGHSTAYGRFVHDDLKTILAQSQLYDGFSSLIR